MHRVLLVDDDPLCIETLGTAFRYEGYDFSGALTGADAVQKAVQFQPHVALIDLCLPDISGLEVLSRLRADSPSTRCILITGYATLDAAVDAMRLGACDCLQKPIFYEEVMKAVSRALTPESAAPSLSSTQHVQPHAFARWADALVRLMDSPSDTPTIAAFARAVGVSVGSFRNWCRTAGLSARRSVALARAIRAVDRHAHDADIQTENLLSIVDVRSVSKFVTAAGGRGRTLPASLPELLAGQHFIINERAVDALRHALRLRGRAVGDDGGDNAKT